MAEMRYMQAVNRALSDSMREDDSVIVLGEDVAAAGGTFAVTRGLRAEFGKERVRDTPISEATIASVAVGAAMSGLKPVLEIMFMDFITLAMDAVVNQAAKARFMYGGRCSVPMVIRTPHGGGLNAGPQHSQCLEAWFAHIPGLKVVCPSNAQDAYSLLRSAIADPDPVIFVEHKALYGKKCEVDTGITAAIGQARIERAGTDVTIVTYGSTVHTCMAAAAELALEGIDAEIIDLRSIQPWDEHTVFASVARTHHAVVVHEATKAFGSGAEIGARIAEAAFYELDAPVARVAPPFMPVPFARSLEEQYMVGSACISAAVRAALA